MKTTLSIFIATFLFSLTTVAQISPELAKIKGIQTELESNTASIIKSWNPDKAEFGQAMYKYNSLQNQFTQTTIYLSYYFGLSKRKQKKERAECEKKIETLMEQAAAYNQFLMENHENARMKTRGIIATLLPLIITNKSVIKSVVDEIMDWIQPKRPDMEIILRDLAQLRLKPWNEYDFPYDY